MSMFQKTDRLQYSLIVDGNEDGQSRKASGLKTYMFRSDNRIIGQPLHRTAWTRKRPPNHIKQLFLLLLLLTSSAAIIYAITQRGLQASSVRCEHPRVRREWRRLSTTQKLDYIDAIKCLQRRPSKLQVGGSLYDDFPYMHRAVGHLTHEQPSFLSWHRYFVHLLETRLRNECQYGGPMPYWDWVLDYEDPASAPVFDTQLGFGGNGDTALAEGPVGGGHCVTNGPFAMNLARYVDLDVEPHCLSRNFRNDTPNGHFTGHLIRPDLIEKTLLEDDLLLFTLRLESGPHNTIPFGIRGDFLSFNAPADPLFFLHHAQLDRLWWKWQTLKPERRGSYSTKRFPKSDEMTSLDDMIVMGEMAEDIPVSEIIDTEGGLLCYVYDDVDQS